MVPASSGSASSVWKCSRWRMAEKPERSSSRDEVRQCPDRQRVRRREAFLHAIDREIGRAGVMVPISCSGMWSGVIVRAPCSSHSPRASVRASRRLDARPAARSSAAQAEDAHVLGHGQLAVRPGSTTPIERPGSPHLPGRTPWSACRSQSWPPARANGPPDGAQIGVVQRFGPPQHHGRERADRRRCRWRRAASAQATGADKNCHADTPAALRYDQLRRPGEAPERDDAAQQHGEGQDLHRRCRAAAGRRSATPARTSRRAWWRSDAAIR